MIHCWLLRDFARFHSCFEVLCIKSAQGLYKIFTFFEVLDENNTIRLRALFTRCDVAVQVIWKPIILFLELIGWPPVFFVAGLGLGSIKKTAMQHVCAMDCN